MSTYSNSSQFGVLKIFFKLKYILFLLPFPTFNRSYPTAFSIKNVIASRVPDATMNI